MNVKTETIRDKIVALLPDLRRSLEIDGEEVAIGGVRIPREVAERILKEFEKEIKSKSNKCGVAWDIIPLNLVISNRNWRSLQESLNQIK